MRSALLLLLPLLGALPAQDLPVEGPILGYAWDAAASRLRPILGIPGSSLLGPPVATDDLALIEISPRQDYALGVTAGSGAVVLLGLAGGRVSAHPLVDVPPGPIRLALSPTGRAAALYYKDSGEVRTLTGLPQAPTLAARLELPGTPDALAVSDAGDAVLVAAAGRLYAGSRFLGPIGPNPPLAFLENSTDAVVADPARNEVFLLRGEAERLILAGERDGISEPVAVAAAGRRALVANAGSRTVAILNLDGGPAVLVHCPCEVTGLQRLRGDALFRLTDSFHVTTYLLEADPAGPRTWFVPPDAAPSRPTRQRSR